MEKIKATIYLTGGLGTEIIRKEGYLINTSFVDYAQYKNTPQVDFIFKGKRKAQRFIKGYNPFFLILEGWETPIIKEEMYYNISESNGFIVKESKGLSCNEENYTLFNDFINPLLKDYIVLFDYRFMIIAEQQYKKMAGVV